MPNWSAPKLWEGGSCWIVGGGKSMPYQFGIPGDVIEGVCTGKLFPSAYSPYLEALHHRHVIGVNNSYLIGHWIDFLFFGDGSWHLVHQHRLAKWPGIKVTCAPKFGNLDEKKAQGIKYLGKDRSHRQGISSSPQRVSWNGNSGAAAISLARHLGVKVIYLLGFDMNAEGKYTHWHGQHGVARKKNPPFKRHLVGFPAIAKDAKEMGITIFNVNKDSAIECFKKISLKDTLKEG
jgi:hypothetical protein